MVAPKVSIVIPSYNRAEFIPATLDSILAQSFTDFEIVFIDDGSTDNTEAILQNYCKQDKRVKYFKQPNSERAVARSYGMSLALGDYLCLVDSDDTWYPQKLEKQLAVMEADHSIVCCYASVNRIDLDGNPVKTASRQHEGHSGEIFFELLMRNFIPSVTPMMRKQAVDRVGAQETSFIPYEDWDFWLRLSREGKFYHIRQPLGDYRLHPGQSVQNVNPEKIEEVTLKVLENNTVPSKIRLKEYLQRVQPKWNYMDFEENDFSDLVAQAFSLAHLRFAYWYILAGDCDTARTKLNVSRRLSASRYWDLRYWGLLVFSYLRDSFAGNWAQSFLGSFH